MKQVKEVSAIDQLMALVDFLNGMGYDTTDLTIGDAFNIKRGIFKVIEGGDDQSLELEGKRIFEVKDGDIFL